MVAGRQVITHPNQQTIIRPGRPFSIRWSCAPHAELSYCNDKLVEIVVCRNMDKQRAVLHKIFRDCGFDDHKARRYAHSECANSANVTKRYISNSTPLMAPGRKVNEFEWNVPRDFPEGDYFISIRNIKFNSRPLKWKVEVTGSVRPLPGPHQSIRACR